ncbi:21212_t:CDS:2, partial [Cetraspora pellucida]
LYLILDQILNKYYLSAKLNPLQLHAHTDELRALVLNNKKKRLTIKKRAQYCAKTKDIWDIWLYALDLAVPKNNTDKAIVAASSHVLQFCRELAEAKYYSQKLRKIRDKHASRVHSNQNPTSQHLEFLSRVAMRYKMEHYNSEIYYTEDDTSDSNLDTDSEPKPEALAPTPKAINKNK